MTGREKRSLATSVQELSANITDNNVEAMVVAPLMNCSARETDMRTLLASASASLKRMKAAYVEAARIHGPAGGGCCGG